MLLALLLGLSTASDTPPYAVAPGVFDTTRPDLGLVPPKGTETASIYAPGDTGDRFSNGVVLIGFKGRLYAQWQSSALHEDTADTWVPYAESRDGLKWSTPRKLRGPGSGGVMHSNGGWWTDGKTLVAYINVWPTGFQSKAGGYTEYMTSTDGVRWSTPRRVTGRDGKPVEGVIEQDPHRLADGRIVTAFHTRPGLIVAPFFTDDPLGTSGWVRGKMENLPLAGPDAGKFSREIEPSLFLRGLCMVMVFRDHAESFRQLASESCDRGATWSRPALTNMPDSRAKQSAGNLPGGTAFLVNAPNTDRIRIPLAVTLSSDGRCFDRAFLLRGKGDLQPLRAAGTFKRPGYSYPKSTIWKGHLYVGYAANKEDAQLTRVPLASLAAKPRTPLPHCPANEEK
ncbi:MAG TPA: sialidase family protein [Sphingomonas sp.]|nr:sialidase family protein [Sphingomonas sp.]